jgi:protein phosphatase
MAWAAVAVVVCTVGLLGWAVFRRTHRRVEDAEVPSVYGRDEDAEVTRISGAAERPTRDALKVIPTEVKELPRQERVLRTLVSAAAQSRRGRTRARNDDAFLAVTRAGLFAIADGVGGRQAGGEASRAAVDMLARALATDEEPGLAGVELRGAGFDRLPRDARSVLGAIFRANRRFSAETEPELRGMSTTLTAIRFSQVGQLVYLAHVGDSRCYRVRRGNAELLTSDHVHGGELTRALGIASCVEIDFRVEAVEIGDIFVLCSDGLTGVLSPQLIASTVEGNSPRRAARELARTATSAGARDDMSIVVVQVTAITLPAPWDPFRVYR